DVPIAIAAMLDAVASPACGGTALFIGTVRDDRDAHSSGRLRYEAYTAMALEQMREIAAGIRRRHAGARGAIVHRGGAIPVGAAGAAIAVATPHRAEAFTECRVAIDTLKREVPIWKLGPRGHAHEDEPC